MQKTFLALCALVSLSMPWALFAGAPTNAELLPGRGGAILL